jgi:hypothetical protein
LVALLTSRVIAILTLSLLLTLATLGINAHTVVVLPCAGVLASLLNVVPAVRLALVGVLASVAFERVVIPIGVNVIASHNWKLDVPDTGSTLRSRAPRSGWLVADVGCRWGTNGRGG